LGPLNLSRRKHRHSLRSVPNSAGSQDRSALPSSIDSTDLPSESLPAPAAEDQSSRALNAPLPSATVVICTRNRPADLNASLDAITRLNPGPDEILVVDNSDGDPATERAAREHGARCVVESGIGLSRARNRGLAESLSQIVAFIDDDALPTEDWLGQLLLAFADPRIALVYGEVESPGTTRDRSLPVRSICA